MDLEKKKFALYLCTATGLYHVYKGRGNIQKKGDLVASSGKFYDILCIDLFFFNSIFE